MRESSGPEVTDGLQTGEAGEAIVGTQPAGFGEFRGCAFGLAGEGVGGSDLGADAWVSRQGAARFFEPNDRLVRARLQQMHQPDLLIPISQGSIAGAEPDGLLDERDRVVYRPGEELALGQGVDCEHVVAIEREHRLVLGNSLRESTLGAQHLSSGETREIALRRRGRGSSCQVFCARHVSRSCVGHIIHNAAREKGSQQTLRLDRPRIERQRALERLNHLSVGVRCPGCQ